MARACSPFMRRRPDTCPLRGGLDAVSRTRDVPSKVVSRCDMAFLAWLRWSRHLPALQGPGQRWRLRMHQYGGACAAVTKHQRTQKRHKALGFVPRIFVNPDCYPSLSLGAGTLLRSAGGKSCRDQAVDRRASAAEYHKLDRSEDDRQALQKVERAAAERAGRRERDE